MPVPDCEGYTYLSMDLLSVNVFDKKYKKQVVEAWTQAVKKSVQQGKGLKWKKPSGRQQAFAVGGKLKLDMKQKGNRTELQAQATVRVNVVPSQVKVLLLSAGPKKLSLASPSEVEGSVQKFVHDFMYSLMKKQVVKVLEKKAAELGRT